MDEFECEKAGSLKVTDSHETYQHIKSRQLFNEVFVLLRPFWPLVLFATCVGILGGLATAWLLATINTGLHTEVNTTHLLLSFVGLCVLSVCGTAVANIANSIVGQKIIAALRKSIATRILRAPIQSIEAHRSYRLMSVLTSDVDTVSGFTFSFSNYAVSLAIAIGGLTYLFVLSPIVFVMAVISLAIGIALRMMSQRTWIKSYEAVRTTQDDLQKQYRAITDGAKELKISRPRRERVFGVLLSDATDRIASLKSSAMQLYWTVDALGSAVFFVMIGLLLAVRNQLQIDSTVISGALLVLLYVKGPVEQVASALPVFDQARISFTRIAALSAELDQLEPQISVRAGEAQTRVPYLRKAIELRDVTYQFPTVSRGTPFALGPINLTINGGEMIFIVGENGSGKTTLIKLLLGLYVPQQGSMLVDGEEITSVERDNYRQLFSTIFSDYYLFDDLAYDVLSADARPHLERLGIAHKVQLDGNRFTTTDLSTGQRKRLALVQAWLEGRPVIVTDEWAADQDPEFRRVFYEELLPEMKQQGKTIIVISHDDRYFHVADRVVHLADGHICNV